MKRLLVAVVIALAIIGCGGGGSIGRGGSPEATTRNAVRESSARALFGAAQSGAIAFGMGGGAGTTGGTVGGGFGFMNIGGFVHQFTPVPGRGAIHPLTAMRAHLAVRQFGSREVGTSGGTEGGTDGSGTGGTGGGWADFYFDDYLGLWVETSATDSSFTQHLYVDEAKTQAAGTFETTFPGGWDSFPYEFRSSFEITAGTFAGAHGLYVTSITSDSSGTSSYENVWPGYGSDKGSWTWGTSTNEWTFEGHAEDGTWYDGNGQFFEDGHGTSLFEDSFGYKFQYVYNADGSGSAKIQGPDKGLPATMNWTAAGHFRIVWADGSVDEWDLWEFIDDGMGTTGSTGGSTGNVSGRSSPR